MANLLTELAEALASGGVETPPPGWATARAIADEAGKSMAQTSKILRAAAESGLVEVRTFRVRAGGKVYPVPHYRRVL